MALGALARSIATRVQPNWRDRLPAVSPLVGRIALGVTVALGIVWVAIAFGWQNQQRSLVGIASASWFTVLLALVVTAAVAVVLIGLIRIFNYPFRSLDLWLGRHTRPWLANLIAAVVVAVVITIFLPDVLGRAFIDWANDTFGAADNGTPAGITQPTTATQSGGPGSLTPWKTLGAEGRNFAGGAPTQAQIQSYVGPTRPAKAPVRVYVGIDSAPTPETRAELAVKELERTGGFDRAVLCVATVTGTGWVDPAAARALEYMWAGDTAIVAQQYSFFPSWISFLVDAQKSEAAGRALNDAIYKKWSSLPETKRPKLIVFGLSLGSFGAEAAFVGPNANASVDALTSRTNGTYLVGPTNTNEIWNQLQDTRLKGSPAWRPREASEHVWFRTRQMSRTSRGTGPTRASCTRCTRPTPLPGGTGAPSGAAHRGSTTPPGPTCPAPCAGPPSSPGSKPSATSSTGSAPIPATATTTPTRTPRGGPPSYHPPTGLPPTAHDSTSSS